MQHPILSGLCGAMASFAGKQVFADDNQFALRIVSFLAMLLLNKWMLEFNFKSLQLNGASFTVVVQFITNTIINGITGLLIGEILQIRWFAGIAFLCAGVWLLSGQRQPTAAAEARKKE